MHKLLSAENRILGTCVDTVAAPDAVAGYDVVGHKALAHTGTAALAGSMILQIFTVTIHGFQKCLPKMPERYLRRLHTLTDLS